MDQTVAVAVITAGAAVSASGLTSWIAMRNARQQVEQQLLLAREERTDRRAAEHRAARRDAYAHFLSEAISTAATIRQAREQDISEELFQSHYAAASESLTLLLQAGVPALIEGPAEVAKAVREVRSALRTELEAVLAAHEQTGTMDAALEAADQRRSAVGAMSTVARAALGASIDSH
ncbi:hypothetical protein M4V62_27325 [Streptomyces durmitorensis]|uniref:Proline dehydrogenase n=1 Tax=Streptomyces durmitorensis TaxID=319947 RepID=A0ABY4PZB3_9ACTN|nr:hypothetical protein [Streptomyces durmitorensis]UQT58489.1 hypothetical protein M4V62_27325 [Streptomyces durmitorensis]